MQIFIALPWKYHSRRRATVPSCNGWKVKTGTKILASLPGVTQGGRGLSPRGSTVCCWGYSAGPRYDQEQLVVAVLSQAKTNQGQDDEEVEYPRD